MIVGVAGHIDHGKSALTRALTGVDTDRLKEEKARGISIDLGFAYLPSPAGGIIGFVDAPGHRRFIRNMIAGASGVDVLLLVVAADDGVMPQTREHLAIAGLLGVRRGLIALSKTDLVPDDWRAAMIEETRALVDASPLAGAELFPVSTRTGEGVEALRAALFEMAEKKPSARDDDGRFRLAVDRCFTLAGAGTVVTGPVMSGSVSLGDVVTVSPSGIEARVRGLHAQNRAAETGRRGDRCALNLAGERVSKDAIARGDMIVDPFLHAPVDRIDCALRLLESEPRALTHWTPVRLHHGAAERSARIALLQNAPIAPGETGRVQLVLDAPVAAAAGDVFVIRDASGVRTMGGGRFLDLRAPRRRRKSPDRLTQLAAMAESDHAQRLRALLGCKPFYVNAVSFARDHALVERAMAAALDAVPHADANGDIFSRKTWNRLRENAREALEDFHEMHPSETGMTSARLAEALDPALQSDVAESVLDALAKEGVLSVSGGAYRLPDHKLTLGGQDEIAWARMAPHFRGEARFRPPRVNEVAERLRLKEDDARRVLKTKARQGETVEIVADHFFLRDAIDEAAAIAEDLGAASPDGFFAAAALRDRLDNGRKLSIQILEYFDRQGVTFRRGDQRRIDAQRLGRFLGRAQIAGAAE